MKDKLTSAQSRIYVSQVQQGYVIVVLTGSCTRLPQVAASLPTRVGIVSQ